MEYSEETLAKLSDRELQSEWEKFLAYSYEKQRLRGLVQSILRKKSPERPVKAENIPEGGMATTKLGEKEILLAKVEGKIYAIDNACGHLYYPLHRGRLDAHVVTCIWHFAKFDVRTGEVITAGIDVNPIKRFEAKKDADGTLRVGKEL